MEQEQSAYTAAGPRWAEQPARTVRLLKAPEVADRLNVSEAKVWKLLSRGELDSLKIDFSRLIPETAVDEFIARKLAEEQARRAGSAA